MAADEHPRQVIDSRKTLPIGRPGTANRYGQIYLNGRFKTQALTGVQRFAAEICAALDCLWPAEGLAFGLRMLVPRLVNEDAPYQAIQLKTVGHLGGHLWEQFELPYRTRDGLLINLANTGPVLAKHQLVLLHDASVYALPETFSLQYRACHKVLHWSMSHLRTRIATISNFSSHQIAKYLNIDEATILGPVPEGADHILRVQADDSVLQRHNLKPRAYVLAVGSLARHKNLSALAATADMLGERGITLAIVGGMNTTIFAAGDAGLPRSAKYLGRVSDQQLRALYENAACFVFPSRYEGFGLPPIEAMACNCPVVAATAAAVMEVCGEAALYCDPDDQVAIAATVRRVIEDPALTETLRTRGRERAKMFTWEAAARALIGVIERIQAEERMQQDVSI
jgi:hypothetical protein